MLHRRDARTPTATRRSRMNLEGGYGLFIYMMIPIAFVIVLGNVAFATAALVDPKTIFVHYSAKVFGAGAGSSILTWLIAWMLILALILSALNAITGTARSLHQMSTDGQFPRFFQHTNKHGVPDRSMIFNVVCSIASCSWAARSRSTRSPTSATWPRSSRCWSATTCCASTGRTCGRPFKLPEWMKYVALVIAGVLHDHLLLRRAAYTLPARATRPDARRSSYYFIGIGGRCSPTCRCTGIARNARTGENGRRRRRRCRPRKARAPVRNCGAGPSRSWQFLAACAGPRL